MQNTELSETILSAGRSHPLRRVIIIMIVLLISTGGFFWWQSRQSSSNAGPSFITEPIRKGDVSLTITATGTLKPTNQVTIGSEVSGTVAVVNVDINDHVTKGQELAKLDTTKLAQSTERSRASLLSAEASVEQAEATVKEAEAALARFRELHEISGGRSPSKADMESSIATLDRATADLSSAKAKVSEADADLKSNESDLGKAILRSPVDGVVLSRSIEVGQTVAAQFTAPELFVIAEDLKSMDLIVEVAEADIGRVESGQNASFAVDAWPKRTYSAVVRKVAFGSSNSSSNAAAATTSGLVTYSTELNVPNDDMTLRPGMTATAEVAVAEAKNVFLVPNTALRFDPGQVASEASAAPKKSLIQSLTPSRPGRGGGGGGGRPKGDEKPKGEAEKIWILRDGKAVPIPVTTGISDGRHTEVEGRDLDEKMEVIVSVKQPAAP